MEKIILIILCFYGTSSWSQDTTVANLVTSQRTFIYQSEFNDSIKYIVSFVLDSNFAKIYTTEVVNEKFYKYTKNDIDWVINSLDSMKSSPSKIKNDFLILYNELYWVFKSVKEAKIIKSSSWEVKNIEYLKYVIRFKDGYVLVPNKILLGGIPFVLTHPTAQDINN